MPQPLRLAHFTDFLHRKPCNDFIYREIAQRMHARLSLIKHPPACLLDAGCGTGADLAQLHERFPQAQIIAVDAAIHRVQNSSPQYQRLCADFSALPLKNHAIDLLWSNLALHWHCALGAVFAHWRKLVRPNGVLFFSCFGPDTLQELRAAFAAIGQEAGMPVFTEMHDIGDSLLGAGWSTPVMDREVLHCDYQTLTAMWEDVRALGGQLPAARKPGCQGKNSWKKLLDALHAGCAGKFQLSYEIIYGHAFHLPATQNTGLQQQTIRWMPGAAR